MKLTLNPTINNRHHFNSRCKLQEQVKVIAVCLVLSISMQMCCSSAIPIWEFLSRTEKLSYLYSTFAQLVSVHCKATASNQPNLPVNQCKRNLLTYGNEKLQSFSDNKLEEMEPFQHGANEIIWSAIMHDHSSAILVTTRKPYSTPPASSIIILTQSEEKPKPTSTVAFNNNKNNPNPLFDSDRHEQDHKYAMDMDMDYGYGSTSQAQKYNNNNEQQGSSTSYLTGPLVFRVRPDGSPVDEDQHRPLPRDDDLEQYLSTIGVKPESNTDNNRQSSIRSNNTTKHRRIATISSLKQQHFANLALHDQLQLPFVPPSTTSQIRRHFVNGNAAAAAAEMNLAAMFANYYHGRRQTI